jgi:hypothetical protein
MILRRLVAPAALVALAVPALVPRHVQPRAGVVFAQSDPARPHCASVGGMIMTNLAVIGESTTLGTATGDLRVPWLPQFLKCRRVRAGRRSLACNIIL